MTHEQKPESVEFRTRAKHRQHIAQAWQDEGMRQSLAYAWADRELSEAEARGAAEQRRKDAEGDDPKAWIVTQGFYVPFVTLDVGLLRGKPHSVVTPLYTRPANVAALEARVKELEGALAYLKDEALRFASFYPQSSDGRNTFVLFADKIEARAAAIREGGEHG